MWWWSKINYKKMQCLTSKFITPLSISELCKSQNTFSIASLDMRSVTILFGIFVGMKNSVETIIKTVQTRPYSQCLKAGIFKYRELNVVVCDSFVNGGVQETCNQVTIKCPISRTRIESPAKVSDLL
jgi:hypothetical protein